MSITLSRFLRPDTMAVNFPSVWDLPEVDEDLLNKDLADAERFGVAHQPIHDERGDDDHCDEPIDDDGQLDDGRLDGAGHHCDEPAETSVHTVWGRIRAGNPPNYKEVKDVLEMIPDKVAIAAIDAGGYSGHVKHEDIMRRMMAMPHVYGIIRVMRKLRGDHTLWCFFKEDGSSRTLRTGKPEGFLGLRDLIFDAPCRGSNHPDGYMSNHSFLSCADLGKGRPNFVDFVVSML
jgi:hypothetical protein